METLQDSLPEALERVVRRVPDLSDLMARLHFAPEEGQIWLGDQRMLMIHTRSMGDLRRELIETMGKEKARGILTRFGYACGARDAGIAMQMHGSRSDFDSFLAGPQLHALEGVCSVEPVEVSVDVARGHYFGDFYWHNSSEDELHIQSYGIGTEPVCWMQTGYASGFTSVFMGKLILYREIECRGMGHAKCRVVGKPLEEWDDPEEDLRYLQPETFANQIQVRPPATVSASQLEARRGAAFDFGNGLVGVSAQFNAACHMLNRVADTDATVLFLGESGVGKERFAQALHAIGRRRDGPFVAVNCAAIPEDLMESELFGTERGAYTGAAEARPGRFERAHGGTLFLDEIGTLSMAAQAKLLRALQEGEIERLGDSRTRKVDVRVIAATNVDLRAEVRRKRFREDLFYRLNVFPVRLAPLRERREDIPHLIAYFLNKYSGRHGRVPSGFTEKALQALMAYEWPGNIRELENLIERGVILAPEGEAVDVCHLFNAGETVTSIVLELTRAGTLAARGHEEPPAPEPIEDRILDDGVGLAELEQRVVDRALERSGGNVSQAAKLLGLSRAQMAYRVKKQQE